MNDIFVTIGIGACIGACIGIGAWLGWRSASRRAIEKIERETEEIKKRNSRLFY